MKLTFKLIRARLAQFRDDARGSLSVEAAMILPLLTWFYVGSFVWFDAFRVQNTNLKASYTIADMISREFNPVSDSYLNGLNTVFDYLTYSNHPTYVRVTVVHCTSPAPTDPNDPDPCMDDGARDLELCWSWATDGRPAHTAASLAGFIDKIPLMPRGDEIILTETFMAYEPSFSVGLGAQTFENYIVTRPRNGQMKYGTPEASIGCFGA